LSSPKKRKQKFSHLSFFSLKTFMWAWFIQMWGHQAPSHKNPNMRWN
jgi:hypothetical protein